MPRLDGYSFWDQAEVGYKMHMNDIAAAIGLGNLADVDQILDHRCTYAEYYRKYLATVPGVTLFESKPDRTSGHWLFTMHVERRDDFCRMMADKGVRIEQQALASKSLEFVAEKYLPEKIAAGNLLP